MIKEVSVIVFGYLFGSVNPAYILGKYLKNVDIRKEGTGNAGARNAFRVLGRWPGLVTLVFDLSKGVLVIILAQKLGVANTWAYLAGFAAILGHIFPVYIKFRGGQGAAASAGILLYLFYGLLSLHPLPLLAWLILGTVVFLTLLLTRKVDFLPLFVLPVFGVIISLNYRPDTNVYFLYLLTFYLFVLGFYETKKLGLLNFRILSRKIS